MSYMKVGGSVAAMVTALALSAGAYGDAGKSPNGAPGPAGNPNQPAAAPQANGPQGPQGNQDASSNKVKSHGKSTASHGKSQASHGKAGASHGDSEASHGKSLAKGHAKSEAKTQTQSHANPNVGTPRKGGREDRPAGKITICHATKSVTNPYVAITISVNGLHGHGPAEAPHHHADSWKDIIPAPNPAAKDGGCPGTVQAEQNGNSGNEQKPTTTTLAAKLVATTPEVAVTAPATATETPQQAVLGVRTSGTAPAEAGGEAPAQSKVLGAQASGSAPNAALAARNAGDSNGRLPFTGYELAIVLLAAAAALLGGFAIRRATTQGR
jgi:hypothetical protein